MSARSHKLPACMLQESLQAGEGSFLCWLDFFSLGDLIHLPVSKLARGLFLLITLL